MAGHTRQKRTHHGAKQQVCIAPKFKNKQKSKKQIEPSVAARMPTK